MDTNISILKKVRQEKGITRAHLSRKTNINYQRLVRIETDNSKLTLDEVKVLSEFFGKPIYFFD